MEGFLDGLPTMAVNAGVFVGMIIVTVLGGKLAMKTKEPAVTPADAPRVLAAGILQDNTSILMASEAQRVLSERVGTNTHCLERNTDELKELRVSMDQLNRNLERLKKL